MQGKGDAAHLSLVTNKTPHRTQPDRAPQSNRRVLPAPKLPGIEAGTPAPDVVWTLEDLNALPSRTVLLAAAGTVHEVVHPHTLAGAYLRGFDGWQELRRDTLAALLPATVLHRPKEKTRG